MFYDLFSILPCFRVLRLEIGLKNGDCLVIGKHGLSFCFASFGNDLELTK